VIPKSSPIMKMDFRFLVLAILSTTLARSQVIIFNNMFIPSDVTHGGYYVQGSASLGGGRTDAAEQFKTTVAGPAFLTSAIVSFRAAGPAGLMSGTATLFSDAGNTPGSILETTGFSASLLNNAPTLVTATFSGTTLLSSNTSYWIGFSMQPGSRFWAQWNAAQPAFNNRMGSSPDGSSWGVSATNAGGLILNGRTVAVAVPEPAAYGILGAIAALALAVRGRRQCA
jgi:hypothetical protein